MKFRIRSFTLFQNSFNEEVKIRLAFFKDSLGFVGQRISGYFASPPDPGEKGKLTFKFDAPLVFDSTETLFFELSSLSWPTNYILTSIRGDIAIKFTMRDKEDYTLSHRKGSPLLFSSLMTRSVFMQPTFNDTTILDKYNKKLNPIFEYECQCLN